MAGQGKPATLADVARLAGVSSMTVSRVINDAATVSDETQARVREAMGQLRYRPNSLARSLVRGRTNTIGVVIHDTGQYGPGSALLGIERAARQRGYGVSLAAIGSPDRTGVREAVLTLDERMVDGLVVIAPFVGTAGALRGLDRGIPVVVAEAGHPDEATIVGIDQVMGARLATRHLIDLGHRTVHHVAGPPDWIESRERAAGWRDALAASGIAAPEPLEGNWTARSGYEAGVRLAADPEVTAVFVGNDQMALGVLHAFHAQQVAVPGDISIVGFDDTPESAYYSPALTTIRQDFGELGQMAVQVLDQLVGAGAVAPVAQHLIQPTLVLRASTGPPRR